MFNILKSAQPHLIDSIFMPLRISAFERSKWGSSKYILSPNLLFPILSKIYFMKYLCWTTYERIIILDNYIINIDKKWNIIPNLFAILLSLCLRVESQITGLVWIKFIKWSFSGCMGCRFWASNSERTSRSKTVLTTSTELTMVKTLLI